ncbi:hypothetical protein, conserved [Plasmodium gonderi]|uniref:PNPLA domain-containing protein n=1 Tax=Plasmodium gonderi TaxID=77519 RepID=A0A1Y1JGN3_PLAGO|nr:hypothetical protein, conserved [Plasmodium gonderi]GAW81676.1 hypothetical protein, conserved [Plasmodium gonderi]
MNKNVYIFLVYGIYSILMFSKSLRMQKNIFKYITPISKKLSLTKFRKIKFFRKRSQLKRVKVFNDVVNKYIGLDLFFKKLNHVTDTQEKLNYINFLHKIVEDKTCEHLLFSSNHIRTIIYILNERFLILKKNDDINDYIDYQIIYKLLLIFKNLTKYKKFYRIILNDFTHKNVKISLIYVIMNILNEKDNNNNSYNNNETYKEDNSFLSYFISLFKNNSDVTKNQVTDNTSDGKNSKMIKGKSQMKSEDIEEIKNKIVLLGKHILLKLKEEKVRVDNMSNECYNAGEEEPILTNEVYTKDEFCYDKRDESRYHPSTKEELESMGDNDQYSSSRQNDENPHIGKYQTDMSEPPIKQNKRDVTEPGVKKADATKAGAVKAGGAKAGAVKAGGAKADAAKADATEVGAAKADNWGSHNNKGEGNPQKSSSFTDDDQHIKVISYEKGDYYKEGLAHGRNERYMNTRLKQGEIQSDEMNQVNRTVSNSQDNVLFIPFYFNKNSKDNILTSILVQFQNANGVVVYKRKMRYGLQDRTDDLHPRTDRYTKKKNIIECIGEEYNCNNYFEVYENYAEDDVDILKYEKNNNRKKFHIRESKHERRDGGIDDKMNSREDVPEERRDMEEEGVEEDEKEEEEEEEEVKEEEEEEGEEEEEENDDEEDIEEQNYEEDLENDEHDDKHEYKSKYDENKVNIILNDYNVNIKDIENKPEGTTNDISENKSNFLNMGLLILIKKNMHTEDDGSIRLNTGNDSVKEGIYENFQMASEVSTTDLPPIETSRTEPAGKTYTSSNKTEQMNRLHNYLNAQKYLNNKDLKFSLCRKSEPREAQSSRQMEGLEQIYIKHKEGEKRENAEGYVLTGFIHFNLDLLKSSKVSNDDNNVDKGKSAINISNPYLNFALVENYIECLFKYIDLNSYFTNKLLKLLYEILVENKNSVIYNLYYYTIMKKENMNKIIKILSKNLKNDLNRSNITLILRILYILSFQQDFYINRLKSRKSNENYMFVYRNISKYLQDIKVGSFIKELQKWGELIECLKSLSLFFENKYKNQNSYYISDEKKERFLLDNKIFKKKLNNIYNRHFICEYKDLIIIRKTNILLKALGVNMFDLYNDIIFTDREKKAHDYLMKENENQKSFIHHAIHTFSKYFINTKRYIMKHILEEITSRDQVPGRCNGFVSTAHWNNPSVEQKILEEKKGGNSINGVKNESMSMNNYSTCKSTKEFQRLSSKEGEVNQRGKSHQKSFESSNGKKQQDAIPLNYENGNTNDIVDRKNRKKRMYLYNLNSKEHISMDKFRNLVITLKRKKKRKLRILCLDGGGIRGLLSIEILKCINSHLKKNIFEYFDIICGTSTGAIISILIGLEKAHLNEIEFLYNLLINKIFQKDMYAVRNTRYLLKHSYYDSNILSNILNSFFKNIKMFHYNADFFTPYVFTVSTQMNVTPLQPVILKNYNSNLNIIKGNKGTNGLDALISTNYDSIGDEEDDEMVHDRGGTHTLNDFSNGDLEDELKDKPKGVLEEEKASWREKIQTNTVYINQNINNVSIYKSFYNIFVKYVLRCTTAAPGFFNFFSFDNNIYADGAICFNNPTLLSLNEMKLIFYNYLNNQKNTLLYKLKHYFSKDKQTVLDEKNKAINLNDYIDCIVSVGTGKFKPKNINELNDNKTYDTFLRWDVLLKQIVYSITNTELTHDICNNLLDKNKYFRFNCFINNIKLDETSPEIINKMKQIGKRYFQDHKYNQEKLIKLIDILEDPSDVKEYQNRQKKIWNQSYLDKFKSKFSNFLFPNHKTHLDRGEKSFFFSSTNLKSGSLEESTSPGSEKENIVINPATAENADNFTTSNNVRNDTNGSTNNKDFLNSEQRRENIHTSSNHMNTEKKESHQTHTEDRGSNPYRNFNFNFMNEDVKLDLNNIEEILDIINKNSNTDSSRSTSNGFFNYFTNLFYNNNKFLKKLENMHKNNLFNISKKKEKNNYVNVVPNTGIRVLLNEIYFILLKKNLYFHTDEYCSSDEELISKKNYDINIEKIIPCKMPTSEGAGGNTAAPAAHTNEQGENIHMSCENISSNSQRNEEIPRNKSETSSNENDKKTYTNLMNDASSDEDVYADSSLKTKGSLNHSNLGFKNKHQNFALSKKDINYDKNENYYSERTGQDSIREILLKYEGKNISSIDDKSEINKKRSFKNGMNMNHINYEFFKSMSTESSDGKKHNIIQVLRNIFFKENT